MILAYGGKNCWSYKDWLDIQFTVEKKYAPKVDCFPETNIVPFLCFEGSNASGKTSALKVLYFIFNFCKNSFVNQIDAKIPYDTYFNNLQKSEFFLTFTLNNPKEQHNIYEYELILDKNKIYSEVLKVKRGKERKVNLIKRTHSRVTDNFFDFPKNIHPRNNVSVLSTLFQFDLPKGQPFLEFFSNFFSNINDSGFVQDTFNIDKYYYNNPDMLALVAQEINKFDTGLTSIRIETQVSENNEQEYYPVFIHQTAEGDKELRARSESNGTIKLYKELLKYLSVIHRGGLLVLDEIDGGLHNDIVLQLLYLFTDPKNKEKAQLVFTSHNSKLLDTAKRYRSYIFEKKEGESYCYRGDEIPQIRNDKSLTDAYDNNEIGGHPNFA